MLGAMIAYLVGLVLLGFGIYNMAIERPNLGITLMILAVILLNITTVVLGGK